MTVRVFQKWFLLNELHEDEDGTILAKSAHIQVPQKWYFEHLNPKTETTF